MATKEHKAVGESASLVRAPMFPRAVSRATGILAFLCIALTACQTTPERAQAEADKIARAMGDFIAFRKQLPGDLAALKTFTNGGTYGIRWQTFEGVSFYPVADFSVRLDLAYRTGAVD